MTENKGKKQAEEIELSEEDESALDRAWDRIAAEDKAKGKSPQKDK